MKLITRNSAEIKAFLAIELSKQLNGFGFVYQKSNEWFIKQNGEFNYIIYPYLHSLRNHYSIEVFLYIRQKSIEKIFKKIIHSTTNLTMGNTFGVIYNSANGIEVNHHNMDIRLFQDEDLDAAVETIFGMYENTGKKYFEKYSSLESINAIINSEPLFAIIADIGGTYIDRCIRGMIVNRLIGGQNFIEISEIYSENIRSLNNPNIILEFDKAYNFLIHTKFEITY